MTPEVVGNAIIIAGIPVMMMRLFVGWSYALRSHRVWTFGLNGLALLVFFVRVTIQRNFEGLISPQDWIAVATWAFLVGAQVVAIVYGYLPERRLRKQGSRR